MAQTTVLTNVGRQIATGLLAAVGSGPGSLVPKYLALGTTGTTAVRTDTALTAEVTTGAWTGYARVIGTATQQTTSTTNDTYQLTGSFTNPSAGGIVGILELGNFDAASAGNMFIHSSFDVVNLQPGDVLTPKITWQLS